MLEKFGVIIPAYQTENTIGTVIESLLELGFSPENIIIVDDGSEDKTHEKAKLYSVTLLRHKKNQGKGAAQKTGFQWISGKDVDGVFTMDADLQHNVDEIPRFLEIFEKGADIIIGTRMHDIQRMPFQRIATNKITSLVISLLIKQRVYDSQSGFRLFRKQILKNISLHTVKYDTESEFLIKAGKQGWSIDSVPISTVYFKSRSFINPILDTLRFIHLAVRSLW